MEGHSGKPLYLSIMPPVHEELGAFFAYGTFAGFQTGRYSHSNQAKET